MRTLLPKPFTANLFPSYALVALIFLFFQNAPYSQNYYPIKVQQKWGLMDAKGAIVVEPKYEVIGTPQEFGYTLIQAGGKVGILNKKGKIAVPATYEEIKILGVNFFEVTELGEKKIINTAGKTVLQTEAYEQLRVLDDDLLAFSQNGQYGCVHANGKQLWSPLYDAISIFNDDFVKVEHGGKWGLRRRSGNLVVPPLGNDLQIVAKNLIFYKKEELWGAVDSIGQALIEPKFNAYQPINARFIKLECFGVFWLYNVSEQKIVSKQAMQDFFPFSESYLLSQKNNAFGIIDTTAQQVLPNTYEEIQYFSDLAFRVRKDRHWGMVNQDNELVLDYVYDFIAPIRNGKALVKKGDLFGLVNERGILIVPVEYSKISISGNNIKAFKGEKWTLFYIDENGNPQQGGHFQKHFKLQIAGTNVEQRISWDNNTLLENNYLLDDFEWFYDNTQRKWGLRRLSDGQYEIEPTFDRIQIERDLGYTIVGIEKQGHYRFDRTNYRFDYLYGIVNNSVGKLVTHLELWDVRSADFRNGSTVARVVFKNGRHGLMQRNGKFVKRDFGYIGEFKNGLAKISIGGKIAARLNPSDKSLGLLPRYLNDLLSGYAMVDVTLHDKQLENEAYLTCEDCTWGFIDTTATISIEPKYEVVNDFINGVSIVKEKGNWGTIDRLGNTLIPKKYTDIQFLENTNNQILQLSAQAEKYGLLDTFGQLIVRLDYDDIGAFYEGRLAVKSGNLWGFVNEKGQEIIPPQYNKVNPFSEGLAAVKYQRRWVFIDPNGKIVLDNHYRAIGNFKEGRAWVKTNKGVGFINQDGTTIIPLEFSQAFDFHQGVARVVKNGKYGLIDLNGDYILKPKFSKISAFDNTNLAIVRYGNNVMRYGVINLAGNLITEQPFKKILPFREGRALVKHKKGYGFIDVNGTLVIEGNYSKAASFSEGRAAVQKNNRCGYIDLAGNEVIPLTYSKCLNFKNGKAVVYEGLKKGGVIDLTGNQLIEPNINRLIDFNEGRGLVRKNYQFYYIAEDASWQDGYFEKAATYQHGIAAVRKNGKWGIINQNGLNIITNKYDDIGHFEHGFAKVHLRQFTGLADLNGNLILPPLYEFITYAGDGLFRVENGGQLGYLAKNGTWVWALKQ